MFIRASILNVFASNNLTMIYDEAILSYFRMRDTRRHVVSERMIKGLEMGLELKVVRLGPSCIMHHLQFHHSLSRS